jgi:steroid 5-alpha reductase family enzyme
MTAALLAGLLAALVLAACVWLASLPLRDVSIVDIAWGWLVMTPAFVAAAWLPDTGPRAALVLALGSLWALRLSVHIAWRHRGQPEDRRYGAMRARHGTAFAVKSLVIVFALQAVLGTIVALPLAGAWWTVVSPLLMTFLLLRVSGVRLLEQDIGERRPSYREYMRRTSAFVPARPRV